MVATGGPRIDWKAERERIDLAAVVTGLLGPPPGRRGERGRRLWWCCPFHADQNPSFSVDPGKVMWRCFGCGESGDAATLVMRLQGVGFAEAVRVLAGGSIPASAGRVPVRPVPKFPNRPPPEPSGLAEADALALVETGAARLWSSEGSKPLAYLTGPRGLSPATIRAHRLGWSPGLVVPKADGGMFRASGWIIPWFAGDRLALVKIRQPDTIQPKYVEAFRYPARVVCYPIPEAIRPGRPLIVTEGEFDGLLLAQILGERASVVTFGSASSRPDVAALGMMLSAPRWYIATDNDPAGNRAAAGWPARSRRVTPPGGSKDWTEAKAGGVNLARWWIAVMAGNDQPPLFTWDELARICWGSNRDEPLAGIVIDPRDDARMISALCHGDLTDSYAVAERLAIREESKD